MSTPVPIDTKMDTPMEMRLSQNLTGSGFLSPSSPAPSSTPVRDPRREPIKIGMARRGMYSLLVSSFQREETYALASIKCQNSTPSIDCGLSEKIHDVNRGTHCKKAVSNRPRQRAPSNHGDERPPFLTHNVPECLPLFVIARAKLAHPVEEEGLQKLERDFRW